MGFPTNFYVEQSGYLPGQESPGIGGAVHEDSEIIK